ncbi:glycosyltransferase family 4 protein [Clostridium sp. DL1XJH146]
MKIAIDSRGINWYRGTGIGTYTDNLVSNLINISDHNYRLYWSEKNYKNFKKNNVDIIYTSKKHSRFFNNIYIPYDLKKSDVDIYHIPQNGIGLETEAHSRYNKIITIHDLIPYILPETVGAGYLRKFLEDVPSIISASDAIITVSECSKKDILKFFPTAKGKVYVTPLAADKIYKPLNREKCKNFLKNKYKIDKNFILYIGGFSERKNVRALIHSFIKAQKWLNDDYYLVLGGARKDIGNSLYQEFGIKNNRILFTGYLPTKELPIFYNAAELFAYPSLYEGFGLPPLEAMCCGTPVITSNISSIPEVVGDAGFLINPFDHYEIEKNIIKILNNIEIKEKLRENSLKRASEFNWIKTAEKTLEIYEKVYNNKNNAL